MPAVHLVRHQAPPQQAVATPGAVPGGYPEPKPPVPPEKPAYLALPSCIDHNKGKLYLHQGKGFFTFDVVVKRVYSEQGVTMVLAHVPQQEDMAVARDVVARSCAEAVDPDYVPRPKPAVPVPPVTDCIEEFMAKGYSYDRARKICADLPRPVPPGMPTPRPDTMPEPCLDVVDGIPVLLYWKHPTQQKPYSLPVKVVDEQQKGINTVYRILAPPSGQAPDGVDMWVLGCNEQASQVDPDYVPRPKPAEPVSGCVKKYMSAGYSYARARKMCAARPAQPSVQPKGPARGPRGMSLARRSNAMGRI